MFSKWWHYALALLISLGVVGTALAGLAAALIYPNLPPLEALTDYKPKLPLRIYTADGALMGITPAMPSGSSLTYMMEEMHDRTFDVGIAEQHAVTFSAGLAALVVAALAIAVSPLFGVALMVHLFKRLSAREIAA